MRHWFTSLVATPIFTSFHTIFRRAAELSCLIFSRVILLADHRFFLVCGCCFLLGYVIRRCGTWLRVGRDRWASFSYGHGHVHVGRHRTTAVRISSLRCHTRWQSAIFDFQSLLIVLLLMICTSAFIRGLFPQMLDAHKDGYVPTIDDPLCHWYPWWLRFTNQTSSLFISSFSTCPSVLLVVVSSLIVRPPTPLGTLTFTHSTRIPLVSWTLAQHPVLRVHTPWSLWYRCALQYIVLASHQHVPVPVSPPQRIHPAQPTHTSSGRLELYGSLQG